jgi:GNAT superfamily N-acetyltransferase
MSREGLAGVPIRGGGFRDVEVILHLWKQADATPSATDTAADLGRLVRALSAVLLVVVVEDEIVGPVIGGFDGWRGNICRRAVRPDCRRRGLARSLVAAAEEWFARQGARRIATLVGKGHPWATGLRAAAGYSAYEHIARYVRNLIG